MPNQLRIAIGTLTARTRIGAGGRSVIPHAIRDALDVREGDDLLLEVDEHGLHVRSVRQAVRRAQQTVARYVTPARSRVTELIEERRREADRE